MGSSEVSGVGALGFRVDNENHARPLRPSYGACATGGRPPRSSVATAITLTSFAAALLFVLYDAATTLGALGHDVSTPAPSIAQESAGASPAPSTSGRIEERFPSIARAGLAHIAELPSSAVGMSARQAMESAAMAGIAGRGAAAFLLAGLVSVVSARRRPDGMPDGPQRHIYERLAASIPLGLAYWTRQGKMILCNDLYRHRLKLNETGQKNAEHDYAEVMGRLAAEGRTKLVRTDARNRSFELHCADGSCLLVEERAMPDGGFVTLVSDVTEYKRTDSLLSSIRQEQRLLAMRYHEEKKRAEAANLAKTNFLAHLSHDIRTPLNHIIGFAELMRHETYGALGDPRYDEYVQSIKASGEHLLTSFAAILDLAELENGQKILRQDPLALDEVIEAVATRFRQQIQQAGLTLVIGQKCDTVLRGDRLGYARMIGNIVENAIRFTPRGGYITLAAYAADDGVVIEITDTGSGMDEARLVSLGQPFALGDATFTRAGVGPGLGISISRTIAELSGGTITIDSCLSMGTTVAISLPTKAQSAQDAA